MVWPEMQLAGGLREVGGFLDSTHHWTSVAISELDNAPPGPLGERPAAAAAAYPICTIPHAGALRFRRWQHGSWLGSRG